MSQVKIRKFATGGGIRINDELYTKEDVNALMDTLSKDEREILAGLVSNINNSGTEYVYDANSNGITGTGAQEWLNSLLGEESAQIATNGDQKRRNRDARWGNRRDSVRKALDKFKLLTHKTPVATAETTPELIDLNKGSGFWKYNDDGSLQDIQENWNRTMLFDKFNDYFKLGREAGDKKYKANIDKDNLDALWAYFGQKGNDYLDKISEKIKSKADLDEGEISFLKALGFEEEQVPEISKLHKETAAKYGMSDEDFNKWFVLGEDGSVGANANLAAILNSWGIDSDRNAYFNDIWDESNNQNKLYNWLKNKFYINGRFYMDGDETLPHLTNSFTTKNREGDFQGSNELIEHLWGSGAAHSGSEEHYGNFFDGSSDLWYNDSQYTDDKGNRIVSYFDASSPTNQYGFRERKYAVVNKHGDFDHEYGTQEGEDLNSLKALGANKWQDLERYNRSSMDKNSIYHDTYSRKVGKMDADGNVEDPIFTWHIGKDKAYLQIPEGKKGASESFVASSLNGKNLKIDRDVYEAFDKIPGFWSKLTASPAKRETFLRLMSKLGQSNFNGRDQINISDALKELGVKGDDYNKLYAYFNQRGTLGRSALLSHLFNWWPSWQIQRGDKHDFIEDEQVFKKGGKIKELPKYYAGGVNKNIISNATAGGKKYKSGNEAGSLNGGWDDLTSYDKAEIAGLTADLVGLIGAFTPAAPTTGIASGLGATAAYTKANLRDGFDLSDVGQIALNTGIGVLGAIPILGSAAKGASVARNLPKVLSKLIKVGIIVPGVGAAGVSAMKAINGEDLNLDDYRNILGGLRIASNTGSAAVKRHNQKGILNEINPTEEVVATTAPTAQKVSFTTDGSNKVELDKSAIANIIGRKNKTDVVKGLRGALKDAAIKAGKSADEAEVFVKNFSDNYLLETAGAKVSRTWLPEKLGGKKILLESEKKKFELPKWAKDLRYTDEKAAGKLKTAEGERVVEQIINSGDKRKIDALVEMIVRDKDLFNKYGDRLGIEKAWGVFGGRRWTMDPKKQVPLLALPPHVEPKLAYVTPIISSESSMKSSILPKEHLSLRDMVKYGDVSEFPTAFEMYGYGRSPYMVDIPASTAKSYLNGTDALEYLAFKKGGVLKAQPGTRLPKPTLNLSGINNVSTPSNAMGQTIQNIANNYMSAITSGTATTPLIQASPLDKYNQEMFNQYWSQYNNAINPDKQNKLDVERINYWSKKYENGEVPYAELSPIAKEAWDRTHKKDELETSTGALGLTEQMNLGHSPDVNKWRLPYYVAADTAELIRNLGTVKKLTDIAKKSNAESLALRGNEQEYYSSTNTSGYDRAMAKLAQSRNLNIPQTSDGLYNAVLNNLRENAISNKEADIEMAKSDQITKDNAQLLNEKRQYAAKRHQNSFADRSAIAQNKATDTNIEGQGIKNEDELLTAFSKGYRDDLRTLENQVNDYRKAIDVGEKTELYKRHLDAAIKNSEEYKAWISNTDNKNKTTSDFITYIQTNNPDELARIQRLAENNSGWDAAARAKSELNYLPPMFTWKR